MNRRAIGLPLATVLVMATSLPVAAAKPQSPPDAAYYDPIVALMEDMYSQGKSQAEIDEALQSEYGWVPIAAADGGGIGTLASENFNVDMKTPTVYYNTQQGRYEASAWFYWKNCGNERCWADDYPAICWAASCDIGGYDGFGISLAKLVTRKTQYFSVYSESNVRTSYSNPWDADDSGATYRNQDRMTCGVGCYNWDHGVIVYAFTIRPSCPKGDYSIKSKLGHTWDGAGVSSITVSTSGIAVTFSGGPDDYWQAVNPINRSWTPCGN